MNISFTKQFKTILALAKTFKTDYIYIQPGCILGLNYVSNDRMSKNNHIMKRSAEMVVEVVGLYCVKDLVDIEKDVKATKCDILCNIMDHTIMSQNVSAYRQFIPDYLMDTITRFSKMAYTYDTTIPNYECGLMDNEQFSSFLTYKSADGQCMLRLDQYLITLFPALINCSNGDRVALQVFDVPNTVEFITKFIITKPSKKISYEVYTRNIKIH